jgi:hypothetical protein
METETFRASNGVTHLFQLITFAKDNRTPTTYPMSSSFLYQRALQPSSLGDADDA